MLSVATEQQNPIVVKLLLADGADALMKDVDGETAGDWAAKFGRAQTIRLLGARKSAAAKTSRAVADASTAKTNIREAAERALALLQSSSVKFREEGGCTACHHTDLTVFAIGEATAHGIHADENVTAELLKEEKATWRGGQDLLMQHWEGGGEVEQVAYPLLGLAALKYPVDLMTGAMVTDLANSQNRDGSWRRVTFARTPMQDTGKSLRTALAAHALRSFTLPARRAEFDDRIRRAGEWLSQARPADTEDRAMQLLGLRWTGAQPDTIRSVAKQLLTEQQPAGGWRQNNGIAPDAYATGLALYALSEAGALMTSDAAYQRGVHFLLSTQASDGSWHVKSRAVKLQPYFQSSFPYDHDRWISASATAWATAALVQAADQPVMKASR